MNKHAAPDDLTGHGVTAPRSGDADVREPATRPGFLRRLGKRLSRLVRLNLLSSLTRRIVFLNIAALVVLVTGILYLNQFREGLIDARVESLLIQGKIIAAAIAASATIETDAITVDPDKLLELKAGETASPFPDTIDAFEFPINPERVAPVLRRLISPTRTRARIYGRDGYLILDSRHLYSQGQILRRQLPPVSAERLGPWKRFTQLVNGWLQRRNLPVYEEIIGNGTGYPEVGRALSGAPATVVRRNKTGELIVSVAVPVQRFRAVHGALLLSTQGSDIDEIVQAERMAIVRVFGIACLVTIILSILLASTIANPLRKLSAAAVRVRHRIRTREEIPDFSERQDEIGNLSSALREMTEALYNRIETNERFAADVSHEIKNPLTSLRSAVETLPIAKTEAARKRLLEVIKDDVARLDRLITDISNASRLDAELARGDAGPVDLEKLLGNLVDEFRKYHSGDRDIRMEFRSAARVRNSASAVVSGHGSRLGQVFGNLVENAVGFVPKPGGRILVTLRRRPDGVEVAIDDNGPGIAESDLDTIFRRFYTDRPGAAAFGQNSGLGLSISRQIVEAHGGTIIAEPKTASLLGGARIVIFLPFEAG